MKIRLLSDIHLETGLFTWQDQGEDVVVLAGDIGVGTQGIEWAKSITKPVIYVAGNHEHWGQADLEANIAAMRAAAKGSNVHFLERNSVVIEVGGEEVRFVGCTLWTDYCSGSRNMVLAALEGSNDYTRIRSPAWNTRNARRIRAFCKRYALHEPSEAWGNLDSVHPTMLLDIHRKSVKWLKRQLQEYGRDPLMSVVVTHHAPSMQSLLRARMVSEGWIGNHDRIRSRDEQAWRMAAYASPLDNIVKRYSHHTALWLHGHVHEPLDYALHNVRVVCNPRGYLEPAMTTKDAQVAALFGVPVSADSIARDQADFTANPERGSVYHFERDKVLDSEDGLVPCLVPQAREQIKELLPIINELRAYIGHSSLEDPALRTLMIHGLRHATEDGNRVTQYIMDELNGARLWPSMPTIGICQFHVSEAGYDFEQREQVDKPVAIMLAELIEAMESAVRYFTGDEYEKYVGGLWSRFDKHWLHACLTRGERVEES